MDRRPVRARLSLLALSAVHLVGMIGAGGLKRDWAATARTLARIAAVALLVALAPAKRS